MQTTTPRSAARSGRWRERIRIRSALLVVFVVFGAFYYWTATSSGVPIELGTTQNDYYNLLTDGFANGQLNLIEAPSPALLALKDPYDPNETANLPNTDVPHDLALYHGKFFLQWGPTPVLTLIWPWRLLHLGQLPQNASVLIFSLAGMAFLLIDLEILCRHFFPRAGPLRLTFAAILLASADAIPFLLRRPAVYEIAVSAALCFAALAIWLLLTAVLGERRRLGRVALASACAGLAAGARVDLIVLGAPLLILAIVEIRRGRGRKLRPLAAYLGPLAIAIAALAYYNYARFGSPFQVGASYQLEGYNPQTTPLFQFGYLLPSLYYYLLVPIRPLFAFPYLALGPPPAYPFGVPSNYVPELLGGILPAAPLTALLFASPALLKRHPRALRTTVALLVGTALLVVLFVALAVPGASERYSVDFSPMLLLAAVLCWLAWETKSRPARGAVTLLGAVLITFSALAGVAVSLSGVNDELRQGSPSTYEALEQDTAFLPRILTSITGRPDIVRVIDPLATYPSNLGDDGTAAIAGTVFYLPAAPTEVDIVSPSARRADLDFHMNRTSASLPSGAVHLDVKNGALTTSYRFRHQVTARLQLQPGLNRIYLSAHAAKPLIPGGLPYVVKIRNLELAVESTPKSPTG